MRVKDMEIKDVEELFGKDTQEYSAVYAVNSAKKTIHQSHRDVSQMGMSNRNNDRLWCG